MTGQAPSSEPITLLILGAGCSACYGYPCARNMVPELKTFAADIEQECPRLHELVVSTIQAFERLEALGTPALTLDDLAWLVHQGKLGDNRDPAKKLDKFRLVEVAKVAVAALFLSKESSAAKSGLSGYRALMRRVLGLEFGSNYRMAAKRTPYRVLSFNYDRLFELGYRQHFDVDLTQAFYGPTGLNSGVLTVVPERVEVDLKRFSFLKLHGSVGFYSYDNYGECEHRHSIPDPAQPPPIKDDRFFYGRDHHLRPGQPNPPLIVFPQRIFSTIIQTTAVHTASTFRGSGMPLSTLPAKLRGSRLLGTPARSQTFLRFGRYSMPLPTVNGSSSRIPRRKRFAGA